MSRRPGGAAVLAAALAAATVVLASARSQLPPAPNTTDGERIRAFLTVFQQMIRDGDVNVWRSLVDPAADVRRANNFAALELRQGVTRVVLIERDREPITLSDGSTGYRLLVDALIESGQRGRAVTWRLDLKNTPASFTVVDTDRLSSVDRLFRLSLNPAREFTARNFVLHAEDIELTLAEGSVFIVETDEGITGLVLLGRGMMNFHPAPDVEKGQLRIFSGSEKLDASFDAAYVRVGRLDFYADLNSLTARPVDLRDFRRAQEVFRDESPKTYHVDFADLTTESWSMAPGDEDIVMEIRTKRYATLTYSRSAAAAEDISVFDRARQKNIAVYTSRARLATRGRFYDEDDGTAFDVLDNDIDMTFIPDRRWIEARARIRLKVRSRQGAGQVSFRLAEPFTVQTVTSEQFGRLFSLRVRNHGTVLINLPAFLLPDTELALTVTYSGRIPPQGEWETPLLERDFGGGPPTAQRFDTVYLVSNRSEWYPRLSTSDYATATLRITVPAAYACIASGELDRNSPTIIEAANPLDRKKRFVFTAERPLRYLSFLVTRMSQVERATVAFSDDEGRARGPAMGGAVYDSIDLAVSAQPRLASQASNVATQSADIVQYFRSLIGDSPYSSLAVVLVEANTPGGHSPGYFSALRRPPKEVPRTWRNDPAAFDNYAEFFPAHEIAHQWWGQAVLSSTLGS